MPRIHLFELEDQSWLPAVLRDAGTAYLRKIAEITGQGAQLAPVIGEALRRSGRRHIVDLCSGAGGPIADVVRALRDEGLDATAELTDLHPNADHLARLCEGEEDRLSWRREPLDATRLPEDAKGLRTLFNAFHHFRPEDARRLLEDAARAGQPIAVVEVVGRHPVVMLGIVFSTIASLFVVPFLRPFRWAYLPLTYIVPLIPLLIVWDGLVSCLRVYSERELEELTAGLDAGGYSWEVTRIPLPPAPVPATALIGLPGDASPETR